MAKREPNVAKESGSRLPHEDPERPQDDRQAYYSKSNPNGPYEEYRRRPYGNKGQQYIEGFATKENVDAWSNRASRNSGPKTAPGTGRKSQGR
jgi:hypothetical protein